MSDRDRPDTLRWPRHLQHITRLTPAQAEQLARQDMRAHGAQVKQFERVRLRELMTQRARANPHYKAVLDHAAMARLVEALQQSRESLRHARTSFGIEETCE